MLTHPRREGTAWVIPLKADGERIPPEGKLAVHRTDDAGATWKRLDTGLPEARIQRVLRDAAAVDSAEPVGVYFGTRGGAVYASADEGETFAEVASPPAGRPVRPGRRGCGCQGHGYRFRKRAGSRGG